MAPTDSVSVTMREDDARQLLVALGYAAGVLQHIAQSEAGHLVAGRLVLHAHSLAGGDDVPLLMEAIEAGQMGAEPPEF